MADAHDEAVSAFCSVTGVSAEEAIEHLSTAGWDRDAALEAFYNQESEQEPEQGDVAMAETSSASEPAYTGPRTLDGRPAPETAGSSRYGSRPVAKKPKKRTGLMTMSALKSGGHDHDEDEDDHDDKHGRGDLFAGGEKSGLAVQDPNAGGPTNSAQKMIRDILAKAKANSAGGQGEAGPSQPAPPSRSWGAGQTLGGEGTASRAIPDNTAGSRPGAAPGRGAQDEVQERVLHIWQDGFSIDDGPLHRFDDPGNAADLHMIRQGRAPLHLMNVQFGQAVDVKLHQHEEEWHQLPRVYRPFGGQGHRLGSPATAAAAASAGVSITPTASAAAVAPASAPAPAAVPSTPTAASAALGPVVDESQPTLSIRVTLPDGTRLPVRFNTTQTIGDLYEFVQRSMAAQAGGRQWVLATFPSKEHTDRSLVLGETAEFKRGGAAMVKWV